MIITIDQLFDILTKSTIYDDDVLPREALVISFSEELQPIDDTIAYSALDGTNISVDIDKKGEVVSLEFH